jgi:hypothetical protein
MMRRGDEELHYSDNSHRWIAPRGVDQDVWEVGVRAHMAQHLATMGGPDSGYEAAESRPRIPRQRKPADQVVVAKADDTVRQTACQLVGQPKLRAVRQPAAPAARKPKLYVVREAS